MTPIIPRLLHSSHQLLPRLAIDKLNRVYDFCVIGVEVEDEEALHCTELIFPLNESCSLALVDVLDHLENLDLRAPERISITWSR